MDLVKRSSPCFSRVFCPGDGFSNPFERFAKTTDFFTKIPGFKGKGSWTTSELGGGGGGGRHKFVWDDYCLHRNDYNLNSWQI